MSTFKEGIEVRQLNLHDISVKIIEEMQKIIEYEVVNGEFKRLTQPQKWERAAREWLEWKHKIKL